MNHDGQNSNPKNMLATIPDTVIPDKHFSLHHLKDVIFCLKKIRILLKHEILIGHSDKLLSLSTGEWKSFMFYIYYERQVLQ